MRSLRRMFGLLRPYPVRATLALVLGVAMIVIGTQVPRVLGTTVDDLVARRPGAVTSGVVALVVLVVGRFVFGGLRRAIGGSLGTDVQRDLRNRLARRLLSLDAAWHDRAATGQLMSRAISDVAAVQSFLAFASVFTVLNALTAVIATVQMWLLSPRLTLVALAFAPILIVLARRYNRQVHRTFQRVQQRVGDLTAVVAETAAGIQVVKAFGREDARRAAFGREADELLSDNLAAARLAARHSPLLALLPELSMVAVLWYGGRLVIAGDITLGTLVAVNSYLALLAMPLGSVSMLSGMTQRAVAGAERVFEVLDAPDGVRDRPGALALPASAHGARITFEGVGFTYSVSTDGPGRQVLTDVDLYVAPGERVALAGDTGSGKSTLAALLTRAYEPTAGRILLDDRDLAGLTLASVRAAVVVVPADPVLFAGTVRDNVTFGAPDATDAEVQDALWAAAALDFAEGLPDGLDTVIGERGLTLSGGQRQRVALARALLCRPRVLVLDDALSQLDAVTEATVLDRLPDAVGTATVLFVTGRGSRTHFADRVVRLDGGRIGLDEYQLEVNRA
jgi:ATP-binding cassette subfamily B protein